MKLKKKHILIISIVAIVLVAAVVVGVCFKEKKPAPVPVQEVSSEIQSSEVSSEVISSQVSEPEILLEITNPSKQKTNTTEPKFTFKGTCDPEFPVLLDGKEIPNTDKGIVSVSVDLKIGKNSFKFTHKEKEYTYEINYTYVVIKGVSPSKSAAYSGNSVITVNVEARAGATVSATFMGKTISLNKSATQNEEDTRVDSETFTNFSGTFTLPEGEKSEKSLGKIVVKATCNGITQSKNSGEIKLKKSSSIKSSDTSVTPKGANYINVGSGLIATIICDSAETFDGNSTDDMSRPTNNYLPKGTQDYCAEATVTNGEKTYYKLRCGRRIYTVAYPKESYKYTVATTSLGTLPDHNEIGIASFENSGQFQYLKLDTMWKAPFYFELKNQSYTNTKTQDYTFSKVTYSYVDITLCYATVLTGSLDIGDDNPIFKSAEIIKNASDYTLRLHLRKTGGFYGWNSYYDSEGKLVFKFLNPAKMENPNSLKGIKIYIDVGHGGADSGAGSYGNGQYEKARNLYLANVLKTKLEAVGATVMMDRTNDKYISSPDRMNLIRNSGANFCIAIHHDSSTSSSPNGFGAYHFTPFSKTAADLIDEKMDATDIYRSNHPVRFHYFFGAKVTDCPVVLTENGFMSNPTDYANILKDNVNAKKAQALVDAILSYFRSIQ